MQSVTELLKQANDFQEEGKLEDAAEIYDRLLTQNPDHAVLLGAMASILMRNSKTLGVAIALFHKSMEKTREKGAKPMTEVLSNLALTYKYSGQPAKALQYLKQAVDADPTAGVLSNYGSTFVETDNPQDGRKWLERAIKLDPGLSMAHWNLSLCILGNANETDDWGRGWDEYEYGQHEGGMRVRQKHVDIPDWDGTPGKKVLVYGEQGIGDEIMFASMLPDIMRDASEVVLDCHPRLATIFENAFGLRCYPTRKEKEVDWLAAENPDYICSIGSLGKFYRRTSAAFPGTPYLKADPLPKGKKFRVGISWTGGRLQQRIARRTVPLNWWQSILNVSDVEFVSLQYTEGSEAEVETVGRLGYIIGQPPEAKATDYNETARLVASCDLVITVCTSIVHLAGALGVPCWVMVPKHPAWRYQRSGRMPWYRSVRLYRQPEVDEGAWLPVVQRIGLDLEDLVHGAQRKVA